MPIDSSTTWSNMASDPEQEEKDRLWKPHPEDEPLGPPPVFSSWGRAYAFVIAFLVLLIVLFYLFTLYYR